jgi:methionyl-tRNA formyltransferase
MLCGKGGIAIRLHQFLVQQPNVQIMPVLCQHEKTSQPPFPSFYDYLTASGYSYHEIPSQQSSSHLQQLLANLQPTLVIAAQLSVIINPATVVAFPNRILNFHYAPLPQYRGVAPIAHAILNGDKTYGITLHAIDAGIDTGPMLTKAMFPIVGLANKAVYQQCEATAYDTFCQLFKPLTTALQQAGHMGSLLTPQDHELARYYSRHQFSYQANVLTGDCSASQAVSFVLAYACPPLSYAHIVYEGNTVPIVRARLCTEEALCDQPYGTIQRVSDTTYRLATRDLWVELIKAEGS